MNDIREVLKYPTSPEEKKAIKKCLNHTMIRSAVFSTMGIGLSIGFLRFVIKGGNMFHRVSLTFFSGLFGGVIGLNTSSTYCLKLFVQLEDSQIGAAARNYVMIQQKDLKDMIEDREFGYREGQDDEEDEMAEDAEFDAEEYEERMKRKKRKKQ